jgi:hypothetical protein
MSQEQNDRYYAGEKLDEMKFRKLGRDVLNRALVRIFWSSSKKDKK